MSTVLKVNHLSIGRKRELLGDISFSVNSGECILLSGANGSGKSTLLLTLAGMLPPLKGTIQPEVIGEMTRIDKDGIQMADSMNNRRDDTALIVMIPTRIPKVKGFTLREFVRTTCFEQSDWLGRLGKDSEEDIEKSLNRLGIIDLADKCIDTLSDGEFQKGCIAAGLVRKAPVILLDEPTAFLDAENRISVLSTIRDIALETGCAVLFSSHDVQDGAKVCSRVLTIGSDRQVRMSGKSAEEKYSCIKTGFKNKNLIFADYDDKQ